MTRDASLSRVSHCLQTTVLALATVGVALLAGCAAGTPAGDGVESIPLLQGRVHGGNQPVQNAYIALYGTSSSGYGGTVTQIAHTTTDGNGNFSFSGTLSCGSSQFVYALATGGNPGINATTNNTAIMLMAAIGPCSTLSGALFADINEVTSVAAAYALSGFLPAGGAGITYTAVTGGAVMPGVATSSTNLQGLRDAFANAANIVNTATGQAYATSITGGTVPQGTINALADILQDCVNSAGPTSPSCSGSAGSLTQATPPTSSGLSAPANSLQAAIDIAQYPGNNVAALFGLVSPTSAFPTSLTTAPNDWTLGVTYTNSALNGALSLAIDATDNVWIGGSQYADIMEFSPQGTMLSPAPSGVSPNSNALGPQGGWAPTLYNANTAGKGDNFRNIAFDPAGNVWFSDGTASGSNKGVYEYTPAGTPTAPTQGTLTERSYAAVNTNVNNYTVASDKFGDIWTESYKKSTCGAATLACNLIEMVPTTYPGVITYGSGAVMDATPDVNGSRGLAVDVNTGNIWTTDIGAAKVSLFPVSFVNGAPATTTASGPTTIALGTGTDASYGVAIDKSANAWVVMTTSGGVYQVSPTGTVVGSEITGNSLTAPANLVIDGNNNLFIANTGASSTTSAIAEYSPATAAFLSPGFGFSPGATYTAGSPATLTGGVVYQAQYVAVDRSGALWTLSSGTGTGTSLSNIVQILGVAAPTDPILADGKYGIKP